MARMVQKTQYRYYKKGSVKMIVAGVNASFEESIDAVARGLEVVVLIYDSKKPSVRLYNFSPQDAEETMQIIDEWMAEYYAN